MGQVLTYPVTSKLVEKYGSKTQKVASVEMQGYRVNMEDAHTIQLKLSDKFPNMSLFAVFDGHGGDKASIFMAERLHKEVAKLDKPNDQAALGKVIADLDREFCSMKSDRENGTTCCFALVVEQKAKPKAKSKNKKKGRKSKVEPAKSWHIIVGNLGDSRAILIKSDGKLHSLTTDHKPENPEEDKRIKAAGGFVHGNRVDGQLAMSRAIGDFKYKDNPEIAPEHQKVIAVPEFVEIDAKEGDLLLLYCDGIVEQMSNEDVKNIAVGALESKEKDLAHILSDICMQSLEKGSKDNMSVIGILFEDGTEFAQKPREFRPGMFTPYSDDETFKKAYLDDAKKHGYEGDELQKLIKSAESKMTLPAKQAPEPSAHNLQALLQHLAGGLGHPPEERDLLLQLLTGGGARIVKDEDGDVHMEEDDSGGGGGGGDGGDGDGDDGGASSRGGSSVTVLDESDEGAGDGDSSRK
jgi:serine/threonine protein phosphatase PrpC